MKARVEPAVDESLQQVLDALLSPVQLERLPAWWRVAHAQGKMLPNAWLFPGLNPMDAMSTRELNRAIHLAVDGAHIDKSVSVHTLPAPSGSSALDGGGVAAHGTERRDDLGIALALQLNAPQWKRRQSRWRGSPITSKQRSNVVRSIQPSIQYALHPARFFARPFGPTPAHLIRVAEVRR